MSIISASIKLKNSNIITYNDQTKDLIYQDKKITFGATNACKLFEALLYNNEKITERQVINDMFCDKTDTRAAVEIKKLKDKVKTALALPETEPFIENIKGRGYRLTGQITLTALPDKLTEHSLQQQTYEAIGYNNLASLITALVKMYPLLEQFFFKTEQGQYLPFHQLKVTPQFPIPINNQLSSVPPLREDPIYAQKRSMGKKIYPGLIYRLIEVSKSNGWQLARTNYTHLIESCDYTQARIFAGWGKLISENANDVNAKLHFLKTSPHIQEWLAKVKNILQGDFSSYLAGIAFNTPIFSKTPTGELKLLLAEGSQLKQAAGGKLHVCPAGMLEFSKDDEEQTELTLEAFQTYAAKECLEETMRFSVNSKSERIIRNFDNTEQEEGDFLSVQSIRRLIEHDLLPELPTTVSTSVLQQCLTISPDKQPFFAVVDAFVLRPEIIVPLYTNDTPQVVTNWENEKITEMTFKNVNDINELANSVNNWAAPGIAAAYLGAKNGLEN